MPLSPDTKHTEPCVTPKPPDTATLGKPNVYCVLCNHIYLGKKICPYCKGHLYTTALRLRDPNWLLQKNSKVK
ncbi:putative zinc ribbon protein [Serratia sp. DD3]|uniref:putative zinc ribbon protein n=1 Tax=Serratia sp. DD3 TaxID=1410619 RepID=UPI00350F9335